MIRINLLVAERGRPQRRVGIALGQRVTLICGAIFVAVIGLVVWQAVSVRGETDRLDEQLRLVDLDLATMSDVVTRRNEFETRGAELARRVALVEELRNEQDGPVRMLDQVSRALPEGVWLTELRQDRADITIQGQAVSLVVLSDLVAALEASGYFTLPVELIDSQVLPQAAGEVIRFEVRAEFMLPSS